MARIVAIEEGALGTVKAVAEDGSLFLFRAWYLEGAYSAMGLGEEDPPDLYALPIDVPDEVLTLALEATLAESRALALLARAEQYRTGLERKLAARAAPRAAVKAALDRLESEGLLSDERYAEAWIRQRSRHHAEGPRSLAAALSSKGVERHAVRRALASAFEGDENHAERLSAIVAAATRLTGNGSGRHETRHGLLELGWRSVDVDDALDSMET